MAKVDEQMFNAAKNADLKINEKTTSKSKIVSVYDVPLEWIEAVSSKTGIKSMSGYMRQALLEKLQKDGLI